MEKSVLVVEDDVEINELLGEYLSLEGLETVKVFDGQTALSKLGTELPSAIILDVMLPDLDGYEVCRQINAHRATAGIPVIMLTCLCQDCDRLKGLAVGAFRYMNKPFLPDDLISLLKDAFSWRSSVAARPPCGQFEISSANLDAMFQGINDMMADVFTRTQLSDSSVATMREGFGILTEWALAWGERTKRDPRILVQYKIRQSANGDLMTSTVATRAGVTPHTPAPGSDTASGVGGISNSNQGVMEWVLSELEPGLLAETLFRPLPPLQVLSKGPLEAVAAFVRVGGNGNGAGGTGTPTSESQETTTLAGWYQFLAKAGAAQFEKGPTTGQVKLLRRLGLDLCPESEAPEAPLAGGAGGIGLSVGNAGTLPTVNNVDGLRIPTRPRPETLAAKPK
ncbi:MAG: response regulator [Phycisphaerae bacterium]